MEAPSICLTGPEIGSANGPSNASKERRQKLPLLSTKSVREPANEKDYSQFALSPMRSPTTARSLLKSGLSTFTPVTAVPVKSPAIGTPGTPLRTTLLERYLAEHRPLGTVSETSPRTSPLALSKAEISEALRNYNAVSPPETNSDCFSPVLGTGPAEQFQGLSPLSFDPSNSAFDDNESEDSVFLITLPWETMSTVWPRRNSFPSYGEEVKKSGNFFKTLPEPRSPNGPKSPISERGFDGRTQPPTPSFLKEAAAKSMTPPPGPTFGAFTDELPPDQGQGGPSPFSPPPAPTAVSFPEVPEPVPSAGRSVFDPPPAPTLSQFPVDLPASPKISYPAPINTSIPRDLRCAPSPNSALYSPVPPESFLDAVLKSPPPGPAPFKLQFAEQLPASPLRSKPAPLDTSPQLGDWEDPVSTVRTPRCPPPAPNATQLHFSEEFPASPARSKPAPIDTSPRLEPFFENSEDPTTAIYADNPPPAPNASKLQFSEQFPASPARSKPAPIDTSPRDHTSQNGERVDPTTAISPGNPPPAPLPSKLQFSEEFPDSPARSKPAPIDTSPRLENGDSPTTAISFGSPPPAPLPSKLQFAEQFHDNPARCKPAPIDTSPQPNHSNSYAEYLNSARTPRNPLPSPLATRFAVRTKRSVRFAEEVKSPEVHSPVPVTPHPLLVKSPRALGGTVDVALMTPTTAELIPKSAVERKGDPWANLPAEVVNEAPRGRPSRRLQQAGRLTRSVSPLSPGAGKEEVVAVRVLPNTVYDPDRGTFVQTKERVTSGQYVLLPGVFP